MNVLVSRERAEKAERIMENWYSANLSQDGIKSMIASLSGKDTSVPEEIPVDEVNANWRKAASMMRGIK